MGWESQRKNKLVSGAMEMGLCPHEIAHSSWKEPQEAEA